MKLKRGVVNLGTRQPVWQHSFLFRFSQAGETHKSIGGNGSKKIGRSFLLRAFARFACFFRKTEKSATRLGPREKNRPLLLPVTL